MVTFINDLQFMMLSMMILGPNQPRNDSDV